MIHLELQPDIEAQLSAEAQAHGLATESYLESIITDHLAQEEDDAIRLGLEDVSAGRTRPLQEVFDEMRQKYAIPR